LKIEYDGAANTMAKKTPKPNSGMNIPDYQFEALARCLLPKIQKYYESEDGKKDLAEYRAAKERQAQAGRGG
jgi:hypothetical protein